ncbi:MAG TPA: DUF202 domain-containing protein [Gammaproteobacteria bacterium]|nr:DUF202 domain-containing protein [Gammaproteobacteria bacterium]
MADEPEQNEPEQLKLMKRMVELAIEQRDLSAERTRMSADRSTMSADRSRMSADRSRMSAERSEFSAERSYQNAERTLSVWIRTSLALMIFGIAIDRFGLMLRELPHVLPPAHYTNDLSAYTGAALVAFGVLMAITTGVRFLAYVAVWHRNHEFPPRHGPYLAPFFALMVSLFGIVLLILMLAFL